MALLFDVAGWALFPSSGFSRPKELPTMRAARLHLHRSRRSYRRGSSDPTQTPCSDADIGLCESIRDAQRRPVSDLVPPLFEHTRSAVCRSAAHFRAVLSNADAGKVEQIAGDSPAPVFSCLEWDCVRRCIWVSCAVMKMELSGCALLHVKRPRRRSRRGLTA